MKSKVSLLLFLLLLPASVLATITWSAHWDNVAITAIGPESAGKITVRASKDDSEFLSLEVQSNYGVRVFEGGIKDPHIESITIQRYSEGVEGFNDRFYVCFYYGDRAKTNYGSEEKPLIEWQHNKVVFTFEPDQVSREIFKNNERWLGSDCNIREILK